MMGAMLLVAIKWIAISPAEVLILLVLFARVLPRVQVGADQLPRLRRPTAGIRHSHSVSRNNAAQRPNRTSDRGSRWSFAPPCASKMSHSATQPGWLRFSAAST